MTNVLYISYDGLTDPLGASQILPYLEALSLEGYAFTIVSLEKPDKDSASLKAELAKKNIDFFPLPYVTSSGILAKQKNNKKLAREVYKLVQSKKFSLIHARSYPASLIALGASKKYGIPFIFDMRGFWANERVDGKIWDLKKPIHKFLYRYFKKKEKILLEKSAQVISLTQAAKNYMVTHFSKHVYEQKITVIPCCADLDHFNLDKEAEREKFRTGLNIAGNSTVLIYSGSVGTWYLLQEMVAFFKKYLEENPNAVFLVLTQKDHGLVHETFKTNNVEASHYRVAAASRQEVPAYIHAADAGLYFIKPAFSKMASSPVKLAEFMACGLPVIANAGIGDVDNHAAENNQVILVDELNEKGFTKAIKLFSNLKKDKRAARNFAETNYSLTLGVERYKTVYENILKPKKSTG